MSTRAGEKGNLARLRAVRRGRMRGQHSGDVLLLDEEAVNVAKHRLQEHFCRERKTGYGAGPFSLELLQAVVVDTAAAGGQR